MISYDEALKIIRAAAGKATATTCALAKAQGRVLATPIIANANLPAFDNSAMDGFAMRANGFAGEIRLSVEQSIAAGDTPTASAATGAVEIMTGAPVPAWCETVVPVENVRVGPQAGTITVDGPIAINRHIRRAGEDVAVGDPLLDVGHQISAEDMMMLAALGVDRVPVLAQPKIAVISTGAELVDDANVPLAPGQIRNSNQPFLVAALQNWSVTVVAMPGHPDEEKAFNLTLQQAMDDGAKLIISTGAVSMGKRDFVPAALEDIGATLLFHKCQIRPGKPILIAKLPNGALFFGLPGNPISAAVGLRFFVVPVLREILKLGKEPVQKAKLVGRFSKHHQLRMFAKAKQINDDGVLRVEVLSGQQSFRMASLLAANCWAEIPETAADLTDGDLVRIYPFIGNEPV